MTDKKTILIVDNEEPIRTLFERSFKELGYSTVCAANLEEALTILNSGHGLDGALIDLGVEREEGQHTSGITPILEGRLPYCIMSGTSYEDDKELSSKYKFFLQKPIDLNDLDNTFKDMLNK